MPPDGIAHIPVVEIVRRHAVGRIAFHIDALDPAAIDEIVDETAGPGREQRVCRCRTGKGRARSPWRCRYRHAAAACRAARSGAPEDRIGSCAARPSSWFCAATKAAWPRLPRSSSSMSNPCDWPRPGTAGGTSAKTCASRILENAFIARSAIAGAWFAGARTLAPVLQLDEGHAGILTGAGEAEAE